MCSLVRVMDRYSKRGGFDWREPFPFSGVNKVYHWKCDVSRNLSDSEKALVLMVSTEAGESNPQSSASDKVLQLMHQRAGKSASVDRVFQSRRSKI
jgi:hypothetical protein